MGTVNEPLVRLDSVELSYDGAPVLAGVDLTLRAGLRLNNDILIIIN